MKRKNMFNILFALFLFFLTINAIYARINFGATSAVRNKAKKLKNEVNKTVLPKITSLTAKFTKIKPLKSTAILCEVNYPLKEQLIYKWSASGGLINGSGSQIVWTAPNDTGIYSISCKVIDSNGWEEQRAIYIYVDNPWYEKTPLPTRREGLAIGVVNNKIYAIGGYNGSWLTVNEEYDPVTNTWRTRADMPTARSNFAIGVVNDKIYAIGGFNYEGGFETYSSKNEAYDPKLNSWSTRMDMPTARAGLALGVVKGKIYAIGGYYHDSEYQFTSKNEEYDPYMNTWTDKAPIPTVRGEAAVGVVNDKIYVIGGITFDGLGHYNTFSENEVYDPLLNQWESKTPLPTARYGTMFGVIDNKIYVIGGGFIDETHQKELFSTNEEYNPEKGSWTTKTDMPTTRYMGAGGVVNNKIYIIGGYNDTYLSTNEVYNPEYDPE